MRCSVCGNDVLDSKLIVHTMETSICTVIIKDVPAFICPSCGEQSFEEKVFKNLIRIKDKAIESLPSQTHILSYSVEISDN